MTVELTDTEAAFLRHILAGIVLQGPRAVVRRDEEIIAGIEAKLTPPEPPKPEEK